MAFGKREKYDPVPEEESSEVEAPIRRSPQTSNLNPYLALLCFVLTVPFVGMLGFFAGRYGAQVNPTDGVDGYLGSSTLNSPAT